MTDRRVRPRLRLRWIGMVVVSASCVLTAGFSSVAGASIGDRGLTPHTARSALSASHISLRAHNDRITGTATILNASPVTVGATTGSIGIRSLSGGRGTGLATFAVDSLAPGHSRTVSLKTPPLRGVSRSGRYETQLCVDVYSQISRFATGSNCLVLGSSPCR